MKIDVRRLTALSLGVALSMILSFVESQLPPLAAVPGVKLGLANTVTVSLLYIYGAREAAVVSFVRVMLSALLFGNTVALIYSLSGAALSLFVMLLARRFLPFGKVGVSVLGGIMHNAGQILAAAVVMETGAIAIYMIPLAVSGTLAGIAVGILSALIVLRLSRFLKK